jgi:hypothetical protein
MTTAELTMRQGPPTDVYEIPNFDEVGVEAEQNPQIERTSEVLASAQVELNLSKKR